MPVDALAPGIAKASTANEMECGTQILLSLLSINLNHPLCFSVEYIKYKIYIHVSWNIN